MSDIDFGQISEALNDKADRDMMNVDTAGGADAVVEYQEPTSANNYTWYRKYASGWVEQGGETSIEASTQTVNLPIEMSNTSYAVLITMQYDSTNALYSRNIGTRTTTSFTAQCNNTRRFVWRVSGIAAN